MAMLRDGHCQPVPADAAPLERDQIPALLGELHTDWHSDAASTAIARRFSFKDFHHTMAFVNAVAWIAHQEDHHPDMEVGYNRCVVHFSTHSIGGLSLNDFICAAKIDALMHAS